MHNTKLPLKIRLANYFIGPSFNIANKKGKIKDPNNFIMLMALIFSLILLSIFRGIENWFGDFGYFITSLVMPISLAASLVVAIPLMIIIHKRKYFVIADGLGFIGLVLMIEFIVIVGSRYGVIYSGDSKNYLIFYFMALPMIILAFTLGVRAFRLFYKLFKTEKVVVSERLEDYDFRINRLKKVFYRFGKYFISNWGQILVVIALISLAVATLVPLVMLISRSFNPKDFDIVHPYDVPTKFTFENYANIFVDLLPAFGNSLLTTVAVTLGALICSSLLAYAFIRFKFPLKSVLFYCIIALMMIPGVLTLISRFQLVANLHIDGNLLGIILPGIAGYTPMAFMLLFTFFSGIPHDLFEAADVDGASDFSVYLNVTLPLSKPILSTILIQTFVGEWNDYLWASLIIGNDESLMTLPVVLQRMSADVAASNGAQAFSPVFAGYVLSAIPLLIIFIVASKQFIEGLTSGAFKM